MKFFSMILFVFFGMGCGRKICSSEAKTNMEIFQKQLNVITSYEGGKKSVLVEDYRQALFFMSFVTGIDAKAGYSSTIGYSSKEDYKKNIQEWKEWYKKNKCKLTDHYIDSVYKRVGLEYKR
ncbi:hypothetical protein QEG73_21405 [Chitinophagaceae bacterium 26-R-25]|nr:hypothetical protein [Chitinophagaceae bacterium 26-R-25]